MCAFTSTTGSAKLLIAKNRIRRGRRESLHPRFLADRRFIAVKKISDRDRDRPNPCRCASGEHLRPTNGDYARNSSVELLLIRNASGRLRDYDGHTFLWLHEDGDLP